MIFQLNHYGNFPFQTKGLNINVQITEHMFKKLNISKKQMELLVFLSKNPSQKFFERELSRKSKISLGSISNYLREFEKIDFMKKEKQGKFFLYKINTDNPVVRQFKVFLNVFELRGLTEKLKQFSRKVILFGSCSKGEDNENSDIDLFILTDEKEMAREKIEEFKLSKKINPIILNSNDFSQLQKNDNALYERILGGIELWSGENE